MFSIYAIRAPFQLVTYRRFLWTWASIANWRLRSVSLFRSFLVEAPYNKQLQRTVIRHRGDGASAPFHYALAARITRQHAAAELRR
jgi:hypothetical protein